MADRNRSDLDREQRGSSNPNQRPEDRSTSSQETGMGGSSRQPSQERDKGVGSESEDRGEGNVGTSRESGSRSTNIEGDEDINRR